MKLPSARRVITTALLLLVFASPARAEFFVVPFGGVNENEPRLFPVAV